MERGNLGRWLLIAAGVFLLITFGSKFFSSPKNVGGYLPTERELIANANQRPPEQLCDLYGPSFHAQLTTRGASLKHFLLTSAKYKKDGKPIDLSTTPDVEFRRQLRFDWRNAAVNVPEANWNVDADSFDWQLTKNNGKECEFAYSTDKVRLTKIVSTTARPYELKVDSSITNISDRPLVHALSVYTDAWRTNQEVAGGMFTVSPLVTHVECVLDNGKATRVRPEDFEPEDFKNAEYFPRNQLSRGDWYQVGGKPEFAAVSNAYFSHALVPLSGAAAPTCQLQIEERWDYRSHTKESDPNAGAMYRARLAYPKRELQPNQTDSYSLLTYVGPKERAVLAAAGGGKHQLSELIDLGFFSAIAKILVAFLLKVHSVIPNWGIAIILLTITARTLLFPLALPSIKGMIKMRELKPEIDRLNEKFKDDAQAKGLAQMELWRKHNVNPLKGCLPQMASMPVWFALYTTLQTAVELYNIPFLWFPDLSARDPLYILPFIIGGTSFIQQKLMPMQGDPAQQKMMLYFMPAMFTVFMLFLPAGLGVYMFTNGVLGILQQQAVEWHVRRTVPPAGNADIKVKVIEDSSSPASRGGKGKGSSPPAKLAEDGPLLDKRKA
jgi:YidC/Oxa1 family membrane protein insertase